MFGNHFRECGFVRAAQGVEILTTENDVVRQESGESYLTALHLILEKRLERTTTGYPGIPLVFHANQDNFHTAQILPVLMCHIMKSWINCRSEEWSFATEDRLIDYCIHILQDNETPQYTVKWISYELSLISTLIIYENEINQMPPSST